jgi:hypothetical protein
MKNLTPEDWGNGYTEGACGMNHVYVISLKHLTAVESPSKTKHCNECGYLMTRRSALK